MREKSIILPPYKTWEERVREKRAAITEPFGQPALNVKTGIVKQLGPMRVNVRRYSETPRGPWVGYKIEPGQDEWDPGKMNTILKGRQEISYRTNRPVETPLYDTERGSLLYAFRGGVLTEEELEPIWRELKEEEKKQVPEWEEKQRPILEERRKAYQKKIVEPNIFKEARQREEEKSRKIRETPQKVIEYGATVEQLLADGGWTAEEIRKYRESRGQDYRPPEFKVPGTKFKPHGLPKGRIEVPKEKLEYLEPEAEMLEKLVPGSYMALQKAQLNYKNNPSPTTKKELENLWNSISINAADKAKKDPSVAKIKIGRASCRERV